jgi:hypothetical protein
MDRVQNPSNSESLFPTRRIVWHYIVLEIEIIVKQIEAKVKNVKLSLRLIN